MRGLTRVRPSRRLLTAVVGLTLVAASGGATLTAAAPAGAEDGAGQRQGARTPYAARPFAATAARGTLACDPAGPSPADGQVAASLNPRMTGKMAGALTAYRISCARVVVDAVKARGLNAKAAQVAAAVIIVESTMMNLGDAVDYDSLGLFQQRESIYCPGNAGVCLDPVRATNAFLNEMQRIYPNGSWNNAAIGDVAADVQRPRSDLRYLYGVQAADAIAIVGALFNRAPAVPATPAPYESGRVVSGRSQDGRLETFAAGPDGVWHAWQTRPNGDFSSWELLGGPKNAELAIAPNADGRMELFALSATTLQHIWQKSNNQAFSSWATLGTGGHDLAVGQNQDGRIEVFASNPSGVFHTWQLGGGRWADWTGTGGPASSKLEIEVSPDGRLEVFALNADTFGHLFQTKPSGSFGSWENFGGGGHDLTVDHSLDGRLEVFASGPVGVFHKYQRNATTWSGWEATGGPANSELASERSVDGRVEVFAINDDVLQHSYQQGVNAAFSAWEDFGTGGTEVVGTKNADGRIELFGANPDGVFHKWQTGFSTWSDWRWLADSAGPGLP